MKQFFTTLAAVIIVGLMAAGGMYVYLNETRIKPLAQAPAAPAPASAPSAAPAEPSKPEPTKPSAPAPVCPETPQVFFFDKLSFPAADVARIQSDVAAPLVAYYGSIGQPVVAMTVKRTSDTEIIVEAILDLPGTSEPGSYGFVDTKVGGVFPHWEPEVMERF